MMRTTMTMLSLIVLLSACSVHSKKDYDASANCQAMGYSPGNAAYDKCLSDEKVAAMMAQQQREYEEMKQQQQDWTLRRY